MRSEWQSAREGEGGEPRFGAGEQTTTHCSRLSGGGGVVVASEVESLGDPVGGRGSASVQLGEKREESSLEGDVDRVLDSPEELVSGSPRVDWHVGEGVNSLVARDGEDSRDEEASLAVLGVGLVVARLELDRVLARAV